MNPPMNHCTCSGDGREGCVTGCSFYLALNDFVWKELFFSLLFMSFPLSKFYILQLVIVFSCFFFSVSDMFKSYLADLQQTHG